MRRTAPLLYPAVKPRVISRLRRGYIRPSGGHIFMAQCRRGKSARGAGAPSPPSEGFGFQAPPVADTARKASRCRPQVQGVCRSTSGGRRGGKGGTAYKGLKRRDGGRESATSYSVYTEPDNCVPHSIPLSFHQLVEVYPFSFVTKRKAVKR